MEATRAIGGRKGDRRRDEEKRRTNRRTENLNYNQNAVFKERKFIIMAMLKMKMAVSMII